MSDERCVFCVMRGGGRGRMFAEGTVEAGAFFAGEVMGYRFIFCIFVAVNAPVRCAVRA